MIEVAVNGLPDLADLDSMAVEELADVVAVAQLYQSAAGRVIDQAKARMIPLLGKRGWAKLGALVYRVGPHRSWRLRSEREPEFWEQVETRGLARRLFSPGSARIGGLREVFADYLDPETGEVGLSVLIEETDGEVAVTVSPSDLARLPKFMREADDGVYPREGT